MADNEPMVIEFDVVTTRKYKIEVPRTFMDGGMQSWLSDIETQAARGQDFDHVRAIQANILKGWLLRPGIDLHRNLLQGGLITPPSEEEVVVRRLGAYYGEAVL